ncbi:MAG: alpha/beta hydrolase [Chthonomonas sp.]|nr:alpha/beta hydrolase [Chthonomonas sp.]
MLAAMLALALVAPGDVDRGIYTIHYAMDGKGPAMVMIVGGPGFPGSTLEPLAAQIRHKTTTILFDQLGTGGSRSKSGKQLSLSLKATIEDLEALREHLGLKKWIVFGQSWGTFVGMTYASQHPERVSGLVLASNPEPNDEFGPTLDTHLRMRLTTEDAAKIAELEQEADSTPIESTRKLLWVYIPYYFYDLELGRKLRDKWDSNEFKPEVMFSLFADILPGSGFMQDLPRAMKRYRGPTLLLQGRQDPCGASAPFQIKEMLPQAKVVLIHKAGHFPWLEQPKAFTGPLLEFVDRVGNR